MTVFPTQIEAVSFEDSVGSVEKRPWDRDAESSRRLKIDDQLDLGRLLDRQVHGFGALEKLVDIVGSAAMGPGEAGSVAHEPSCLDVLGKCQQRGEPVFQGKLGESVRTERWHYVEWDEGRAGAMLLDPLNDPHELRNLVSDPDRSRTVQEMKSLLKHIPTGH